MNRDKNNSTDQNSGLQPAQYANEQNNNADKKNASNQETRVKNANAAGIGALGRNDEKLNSNNSNNTADASDY